MPSTITPPNPIIRSALNLHESDFGAYNFLNHINLSEALYNARLRGYLPQEIRPVDRHLPSAEIVLRNARGGEGTLISAGDIEDGIYYLLGLPVKTFNLLDMVAGWSSLPPSKLETVVETANVLGYITGKIIHSAPFSREGHIQVLSKGEEIERILYAGGTPVMINGEFVKTHFDLVK